MEKDCCVRKFINLREFDLDGFVAIDAIVSITSIDGTTFISLSDGTDPIRVSASSDHVMKVIDLAQGVSR